MMKYYNTFYPRLSKIHHYCQEFITNNHTVSETYKGFDIISNNVNMDIVINSKKVGECVTINGAKREIDKGRYDEWLN